MDTQLAVRQMQHRSWAQMIQSQIDSGLSIPAWCAQNNISTKTFYYRRLRVREDVLNAAEGPTFTEIFPASAVEGSTAITPSNQTSQAAGATTSASTESLSLEVNGVHIRVTESTSMQLLANVLEVIRRA